MDSPAAPYRSIRILKRKSDGSTEVCTDYVSREEALSIQVRGREIATTMRTPGNDEELVTGFFYTEGIISEAKEILSIRSPTFSRSPQNQIDVELLAPPAEGKTLRHGTISSSCGLCGTTDLARIHERFPIITEKSFRCTPDALAQLPAQMRESQKTFESTGGLHAAAIFNEQLELSCLREDVGRHNAVDKVIGWALRNNQFPLDRSILLVSGRISYEIILKALAARCPVIAGVSAPSSMAIDFAQSSGMTLVGFLRPPTFNIYTHIDRIQF